jgi:hypothetical protein
MALRDVQAEEAVLSTRANTSTAIGTRLSTWCETLSSRVMLETKKYHSCRPASAAGDETEAVDHFEATQIEIGLMPTPLLQHSLWMNLYWIEAKTFE